MKNNAAEVLEELRLDHKNMALMLNLLEREANRIFSGEEANFELLTDIMHYMTVYPDAVHHPKEDRIYAELRSVRPDLSAGFERITVDHRHIAEQSLRLRDKVAAVSAGNPMRRNEVVGDALRYVNSLRGHMQWEELDLFRRVDSMIRDGHEIIDAANLIQREDPVFGHSVEKQFSRLCDSIKEFAVCA